MDTKTACKTVADQMEGKPAVEAFGSALGTILRMMVCEFETVRARLDALEQKQNERGPGN